MQCVWRHDRSLEFLHSRDLLDGSFHFLYLKVKKVKRSIQPPLKDGHNKSYLPSISIWDYPVYISFQSTGFFSVNITNDVGASYISVMVGFNLSFVWENTIR